MDMVSLYAERYGGPPDADMPWPLFVSLTEHAGRADAREMLRMTDSVALAISTSFGSGGGAQEVARSKLMAVAYPGDDVDEDGVRYVLKQSPEEEAADG